MYNTLTLRRMMMRRRRRKKKKKKQQPEEEEEEGCSSDDGEEKDVERKMDVVMERSKPLGEEEGENSRSGLRGRRRLYPRGRRRMYVYDEHDRTFWGDVSVILMLYFPFQVYPILVAVLVFQFPKILLPIALVVALVSLGMPLVYLPWLWRRNFLARPLALWHRRVRILTPDEPMLPDRPLIFGVHPHGRVFVSFSIILFLHRWWLVTRSATGGAPLLRRDSHVFFGVTDALMVVPILRNIFGAIGLVSASRAVLRRILDAGNHVALLVGGVQEVCLGTSDDIDTLYLHPRKGFIKLAMESGAGVVPVYCFGENRLFKHTSKACLGFWRSVNRYLPVGAPFPVCGIANMMLPFRGDLLIAFGDPLFPHEGESLDDFHARYVCAIQALFDTYVQHTEKPVALVIV